MNVSEATRSAVTAAVERAAERWGAAGLDHAALVALAAEVAALTDHLGGRPRWEVCPGSDWRVRVTYGEVLLAEARAPRARSRRGAAREAEDARALTVLRRDHRVYRVNRARVRLARRPIRCARESRPRGTPRRSPHSPRGPPDDGDPEPPSLRRAEHDHQVATW